MGYSLSDFYSAERVSKLEVAAPEVVVKVELYLAETALRLSGEEDTGALGEGSTHPTGTGRVGEVDAGR